MSQIASVDFVSRTYWEYVASAMVAGLTDVIDRATPATTAIPRRVFIDAGRFFTLALEAAGDGLPQNPSASIGNYIIAADAAKVRVQSSDDRVQLQNRLQQYADFLVRLQAGNPLVGEDLKIATELKDFFAKVRHDAESEAYDRMAQDAPTATLRLR